MPTIQRLFIAGLVLLAPARLMAQPEYKGPPADTGKKAKVYPDVADLVGAAETELRPAVAALQRQEKSAAKKPLEKLRQNLEKAVSTNPTSRPAAELLGAVYFYLGEAGDKSSYERCVKFLEKVYEKDPDALSAPRFLAWSYSRLGKAKETVTYATQAAALTDKPEIAKEMNELRRPYQDAFLSSWYTYEKYYESPAAKLTRLNPQNNYQLEVVMQITPQFEQDLAAKGLQALAPQLKISNDPETKAYLQKLVDKLVGKSPGGPPFSYQVDVVESPQINAMAFPGKILVNTGLIKFTQSEAELVAVLSHEVAHIYAHHSARMLVASYQKRMIAGQLLAAAGVNNGNLKDQLIGIGVGLGLEVLDRGYSRGEEKEADKLGTHIAFNAGYNPSFMTKFFLRLYEANPKQPFKLLSTHPPTPDRIQYTTAYLEAFPLDQEMQIDSQDFKNIKARIK
jgi:predicted Zn-dependent protease